MHQESPVGDVHDLDPVELVHGLGDAPHVLGVVREHRDVADLRPALGTNEVDRAEQAAGLADRLGQPRERPGSFASRTRSVDENDADGCAALTGDAPGALTSGSSGRGARQINGAGEATPRSAERAASTASCSNSG